MRRRALNDSTAISFDLIRRAWEMRMEQVPNAKIVEFLDTSGYVRRLKVGTKARGNSVQRVTEQKLSKMFKDPFYYGILEQSGMTIDLKELYDFTPMVSEGEWQLVQSYGNARQQKAHDHGYPFTGLFVCQGCGKAMTYGAVQGNGGYYLSFWCQTKKEICTSKGSVRSTMKRRKKFTQKKEAGYKT